MSENELHRVQNPVVRVEGGSSDLARANAILAGVNAPNLLSFDPREPAYDPQWCRMVRDVRLNGVPIDDVIAFDVSRGVVWQLMRDAKGEPEFEQLGPAGFTANSRLAYKRRELTGEYIGVPYCPCDTCSEERLRGGGKRGHVAVSYGVPEDRRSGADRRGS